MSTAVDIEHSEDTDIVTGDAGPCTPDEARELVERAAHAAVTFEDAMREIFRRRAWEPLDYANPHDLILGEFRGNGGLVNPRTGKPYGRAHLYRMARTALFLFELGERTQIDAGDIDIAEKALRAARRNGVDDDELLSEIEQRVKAESVNGPPSPDRVQKIADEVTAKAAGRRSDTPGEEVSENTSASDGGRQAPVTGGDTDTTDWPNTDPHPESGSASAEAADADDDPFDAFGDQESGSMAPRGGQMWDDAVAEASRFTDFTKVLKQVVTVRDAFPSLSEIEDELPEFLDACDDSELDAFSELLDDVDMLLVDLPKAREAIQSIQHAAAERADEM